MRWSWKNYKWLKRQDLPNYDEVIKYAKEIDDKKLKALFCILYLTGARISEVCKVLMKKDIQIIERDNKKIMLVTLPNRKNRYRKIKKIPINIEKEKDLVIPFLEYVDTRPDEKPIFDFTQPRAFNLLKKTGINPHFLRVLRLTHLVTEFGFTDQELKMFAGWTDTRPAKSYIELRWYDLLSKM